MNLICLIFLAMVTILPSCAHSSRSETRVPTKSPALLAVMETRNIYQEKLRAEAANQSGWISSGCDALLLASLFGAAQPDAATFFKATKAEDKPGHWNRRNLDFGTCYPVGSDTSISKDMLLGLAWWSWRAKQRDVLERLVAYGEAHAWVMGEPSDSPAVLGKVVVTPSMAGLFYQIIYRLGGKDHPSRHIPDVFPAGLVGFEAHLQVEGILLHAEVDDTPGVSNIMITRLRDHAARQPKNPFFATALAMFTGDYTHALALLGDETQWPKAELPTEANHCDPWIISRDDGNDWHPCTDAPTDIFYGADFVWMVDLMGRGVSSVE